MDTSSLWLINLLKAACHGRMRYGHAYCLCLCADWRRTVLYVMNVQKVPGLREREYWSPYLAVCWLHGSLWAEFKHTDTHTSLPAVARYLMANVQWSILDVYSRYSCSCFPLWLSFSLPWQPATSKCYQQKRCIVLHVTMGPLSFQASINWD